MKRIPVLLCGLGLLWGLCACSPQPKKAELFAMDTIMSLTACGKEAEAALLEAQRTIHALEQTLSRTRSDSEVSAINAAPGDTPVAVSPALFALLQSARAYSSATGGAFDITVAPVMDVWGFTGEVQQVPTTEALAAARMLVDSQRLVLAHSSVSHPANVTIDLGGIAKGYASDCVEAVFRSHGVTAGVVSLGGNVLALGSRPDGTPWRIAVQDPAAPEGYAGTLSLTDAYAVTSGGYQRYFEENGRQYHHIVDPATGFPAQSGLLSVTVVAAVNGEGDGPGNGALCDALSTALFVMGEEAAVAFWRSGVYAFDMLLVTQDGRVVVTDGLAEGFGPAEENGYAVDYLS